MTPKKKKSFEDSLKRLEEISQMLEADEVGLDESIKLYEEGIKLSKECYDKLNKAELKVNELKADLQSSLNNVTLDDEE